MARLMDLGMERLNQMLLDMGSLSEQTVSAALDAYHKGKMMDEVDRWSKELKKLYDQVSDITIDLIARYQPVASDLRFIKASLEISYGFFRYGRYAHDIVEVLEMFGSLAECDHTDVDTAGQKTKEMIAMSIEAFTKRDVTMARRIVDMDDFVDNTYRQHVKVLSESRQKNVKCSIAETLVLRYLERIADHATYIGDSVIYIVTGTESPG